MTPWRILTRLMAGIALLFLVAPLLVIIPLSFNAEPFFTFTPKMLAFDPAGYSLRWYRAIADDPVWSQALANSLIIGGAATAIATVLGTLAAMGLARGDAPFKGLIMGLIISPMITPIVISAAGMYFFYSDLRLAQTHLGLIVAHAALGVPFVVITVTASLTGYDWNLSRAGASLGAPPLVTFFRITLPLILPGVVSGALFAFATSFDEVVTVLFLGGPDQVTIPRKMWSGIREQISPAILAAATLLICVAIVLLVCVEWLRRRGERLATQR
ncbi:MAG: ABC transporter permease [Alphaproteobacteria bacterium]|nr:ABC transporter permease [Alphaproteobacteria bacterium]